MVKKGGGGEGIFSKFRGELAKRGKLKNSGGFGPWMKLWWPGTCGMMNIALLFSSRKH